MIIKFILFFLLRLLIFWLCWLFIAAWPFLQLWRALQCMGFSLQWTLLLWSTGSRVPRLQQFQLRALEHRLNCGTWIQLPCGMGGLPQSWIELVSSALAGGFFTTEPPGKPLNLFLMISINHFDNQLIKTIFFGCKFYLFTTRYKDFSIMDPINLVKPKPYK